ncbi:MAG TPA: phosphatase PAP2 family protein [Limnochordales bacterium]
MTDLFPGVLLLGAVSLVDEGLYHAVHAGSDSSRRALFGAVTHLGDGLTALGVSLALGLHDPATGGAVGRAAVRAGLVTTAFKLVITRPRPYEDPAACAPGFTLHACASMPSGHAATAFSMARVLAHQYPAYGPLWYGLAALAAWSRVETGVHWPSDVLAGALIGLWVAESVLSRLQPAGHGPDRAASSISRGAGCRRRCAPR